MDDEKKEEPNNFDDEYDEFKQLLSNLGKDRSKNLLTYLMDKVMLFGIDYTNPERMFLMQKLQQFKTPYKELYGKEFFE